MTHTHRSLSSIAREIRADWTRPNYAAVPYLRALSCLDSIHGAYGLDSGRDIVARFLSNAGSWRGETARRIKAELRAILAGGAA